MAYEAVIAILEDVSGYLDDVGAEVEGLAEALRYESPEVLLIARDMGALATRIDAVREQIEAL